MERIHYTIYQIQHRKTGKIYIGKHQTKDLHDDYFGSGKILRRAVAKHGREAFTKTILHDFMTEQEMNDKEKELVTAEFCKRNDTYNICEGGKGGFGYVNRTGQNNKGGNRGAVVNPLFWKRGLESLKRMRLTHPDLYRQAVANRNAAIKEHFRVNGSHWTGKIHTEETKAKISLANKDKQKGSKNSNYGNHWIYNPTLQQNQRIKKSDPLPLGWIEGRKLSW